MNHIIFCLNNQKNHSSSNLCQYEDNKKSNNNINPIKFNPPLKLTNDIKFFYYYHFHTILFDEMERFKSVL